MGYTYTGVSCKITATFDKAITLNALTNGSDSPPVNGNSSPPAVQQVIMAPVTQLTAFQAYGFLYNITVVYNLPDGSTLTISCINNYDETLQYASRVSSGSLYEIVDESLTASGYFWIYSLTVQEQTS
jgi:hypothetical protein